MKQGILALIGRIIGFGLILFLLIIYVILGAHPFLGTVSGPECMEMFVCPLIYLAGLLISFKNLKLAGIIVISSVLLAIIISIIDNETISPFYGCVVSIPGILFLIQVKKNM